MEEVQRNILIQLVGREGQGGGGEGGEGGGVEGVTRSGKGSVGPGVRNVNNGEGEGEVDG